MTGQTEDQVKALRASMSQMNHPFELVEKCEISIELVVRHSNVVPLDLLFPHC